MLYCSFMSASVAFICSIKMHLLHIVSDFLKKNILGSISMPIGLHLKKFFHSSHAVVFVARIVAIVVTDANYELGVSHL